ncbi:Endoribonuclease L-PSP/chorismate mutase-like protein, partial [Scleroderma yunnanense]
MDAVHKYNTPNPYEETFGYCRALRKGPFIFVSGTTAVDLATGKISHPDSAFEQAIKALKEIVTAVEALGGKKEDIVRVRMFVTHENDGNEVGRALKQEMGEVQPTAIMILGGKFVSPDMLVEIEADAV